MLWCCTCLRAISLRTIQSRSAVGVALNRKSAGTTIRRGCGSGRSPCLAALCLLRILKRDLWSGRRHLSYTGLVLAFLVLTGRRAASRLRYLDCTRERGRGTRLLVDCGGVPLQQARLGAC